MMTRPLRHCFLVALAVLALAQANLGAQSRPAQRRLSAVLATSDAYASISAIRALPGGKVLINDPTTRRLLLLDSALKVIKVVADSTPTTSRAYGARYGGLLAFRGDSSLFIDPGSSSMIVVDAEGRLTRVMAVPKPGDLQYMLGGPNGYAAVDAKGGLVYRTKMNAKEPPGITGDTTYVLVGPDTAPLVRFDLAQRRLDTIAYVRVEPSRMRVMRSKTGFGMRLMQDPNPIVDDYAVLPDGSVGIMRGREYRLDLVRPNAPARIGQKIPFDWQRLSEDDKPRIIEEARAKEIRRRAANAAAQGPGSAAPSSPTFITTTTSIGGGGPPRTSVDATPPGANDPLYIDPGEMSDYVPAFAYGSLRADMKGQLWVRTISAKQADGPEYDVISPDGKLVDRVVIPAGTTVVGFGDGGIVYLGVRDASGTRLVRVRER